MTSKKKRGTRNQDNKNVWYFDCAGGLINGCTQLLKCVRLNTKWMWLIVCTLHLNKIVFFSTGA
jgi:hypothetical protein